MSPRLSAVALCRAVMAALLAVVVVAGPAVSPASATGTAESMTIAASLDRVGVLTVTQTLTFSGGAPATITQRLATSVDAGDRHNFHYDISGVKAVAGSTSLGAKTEQDGDHLVVTVSTAKAAGQPITISYQVKGTVEATSAPAGQTTVNVFSWRLLQGLSVPVKTVTGTIEVPAMITYIDCKSGPPTAMGACQSWAGATHDAPIPTFTDGPRGAGEAIQVSFGLPRAAVAANADLRERWSLDRAFRLSQLSLVLSLLTLLLGAALIYALHRRAGRDIRAVGSPLRIAEFAPVAAGQSEFRVLADIRPGQVGTVADERVDPVDVTATLIDLAVRGHLRIHELPMQPHQPLDWRFERRTDGRGRLRPYEELLRDAVAPEGDAGTRVSDISSTVGPIVHEVQSALYDDVVDQGWYDKRPDSARNNWSTIGVIAMMVALVLTALLVAFTTLGLLGLALIVVAAGLLFAAQEMPRRSALGSELLAGLHVLSVELQHHRTDEAPPDRAYSELSEVLPYSVVLGGKDRWLQALADADNDPDVPDPEDLDWYHAHDDWHLRDLPVAMDAFIATVQGRLFGR